MVRMLQVTLALAIFALAGVVKAEDKANPTGTWKWSVTVNDQTREQTLKLKLDGDKLTGSMLGRNNQETPIENASYKDSEISFAVTRDRNGMKLTTKYSGKVSGDTIKGKTETTRDGQARSRDWEAKRAA